MTEVKVCRKIFYAIDGAFVGGRGPKQESVITTIEDDLRDHRINGVPNLDGQEMVRVNEQQLRKWGIDPETASRLIVEWRGKNV